MPPRPPERQRPKTIGEMNLAELEVLVDELNAEIISADCTPCRRDRLGPKIRRAEERIFRLRRRNAIARAQEEAEATGG